MYSPQLVGLIITSQPHTCGTRLEQIILSNTRRCMEETIHKYLVGCSVATLYPLFFDTLMHQINQVGGRKQHVNNTARTPIHPLANPTTPPHRTRACSESLQLGLWNSIRETTLIFLQPAKNKLRTQHWVQTGCCMDASRFSQLQDNWIRHQHETIYSYLAANNTPLIAQGADAISARCFYGTIILLICQPLKSSEWSRGLLWAGILLIYM